MPLDQIEYFMFLNSSSVTFLSILTVIFEKSFIERESKNTLKSINILFAMKPQFLVLRELFHMPLLQAHKG
jgi:hypothetical protein